MYFDVFAAIFRYYCPDGCNVVVGMVLELHISRKIRIFVMTGIKFEV